MSSLPDSRVDEILGEKYRVVRFIGEGGMGRVYEAQHTVVGRRFAVKFLHSELARREEILERFKREARAAGALESENIASVIDFGHAEDGIPYLVMELLLGEDLARFLACEAPLPVARATNLIIQACHGLEAAHAAGIIHRDLKPENLFISRRGDGSDLIKILDFGIAKLALAGPEGTLGTVTRTGAPIGTPFYMSPEQARGAKEIDHRTDIYSLGVILFQALCGQKPHPGDSYNEILYHIQTQAPLPIATLRPGLPAELTEILYRALSFDPAHRPASAMELGRALSPFAGQQALRTRSQVELNVTRSSGPARGAGNEGGQGQGHPGLLPLRRPARRWLVAAAAVAVAGGAAGMWLRLGAKEAPKSAPSSAPAPHIGTATALIPAEPPSEPQPARDVKSPSTPDTTTPAPGPALTRAPEPKVSSKQPPRRAGRPPGLGKRHNPVFDSHNPYE